MGAYQNNEQKGGKKTGSRGSVRNQDRLEAFAGRGGKGDADWATCDAEWLLAVVVGITGMGGAITIGLSRDEGAHFLTLLLDDKKRTLWFNGDADLSEELEKVAATLDAIA